MRLLTLTATLVLLAQTGLAQERKSNSSRTSHRVVVVNGKTVVDEKTVDGKTVDGKPASSRTGRGRDRALRDELRARMRAAGVDPAGAEAAARSTHTRRIVVRDGETVVDEESRNGRPVLGRRGARRTSIDLERVLDRVRAGDPEGLRRAVAEIANKAGAKAEASARTTTSKSSSSTHRSDHRRSDSGKRDAARSDRRDAARSRKRDAGHSGSRDKPDRRRRDR